VRARRIFDGVASLVTSPRSCPPKPAFGRRRMRGEVEAEGFG